MMVGRKAAAGSRVKHENRNHYESEYKNADQAEWAAVLNGSAHVSSGTRDEMMAEAALEQDGLAPGADYMKKDGAEENLQAGVAEIIQERMDLLGGSYPFSLQSNSLVVADGATGTNAYIALLALCNLPSLSSSPYNAAPVAFEYLSLIAAKSFLGPRARGWRFGWPRDNDAQLRIKDAADSLQARSGSHDGGWNWQPRSHLPEDPTARTLKDAGLDFVAWMPWRDTGPGQLQLVGQCACGEDWKWKRHDLDLDYLSQWMRLPIPQPMRALFTPRHVAFPTIIDASAEAGLVFDRIRIVQELIQDDAGKRQAAKFIERITQLGLASKTRAAAE